MKDRVGGKQFKDLPLFSTAGALFWSAPAVLTETSGLSLVEAPPEFRFRLTLFLVFAIKPFALLLRRFIPQ